MQQQGCTPDVVTFTALISAYEKGGQWRRALAAYDMMRQQHCKPDAIVYNAIIDALWETGVVWAQRKALVLYQVQIPSMHVRIHGTDGKIWQIGERVQQCSQT